MKNATLLLFAALSLSASLSASSENPAIYPFRYIVLRSVPHSSDRWPGAFNLQEVNPRSEGEKRIPMAAAAYEGGPAFPQESIWDGNFSRVINSSSDKIRFMMIIHDDKEGPFDAECEVALTANTITNVKVVYEGTEKLRCDIVK